MGTNLLVVVLAIVVVIALGSVAVALISALGAFVASLNSMIALGELMLFGLLAVAGFSIAALVVGYVAGVINTLHVVTSHALYWPQSALSNGNTRLPVLPVPLTAHRRADHAALQGLQLSVSATPSDDLLEWILELDV